MIKLIDYKIIDGDLTRKGLGDLQLVKGIEAKKQSMIIRISVERGSFIYDETLGSRLKLLYREKSSKINKMADLYVREALELEEGIEVMGVEVKWLDKKKILILVSFTWNDIQDSLEVAI